MTGVTCQTLGAIAENTVVLIFRRWLDYATCMVSFATDIVCLLTASRLWSNMASKSEVDLLKATHAKELLQIKLQYNERQMQQNAKVEEERRNMQITCHEAKVKLVEKDSELQVALAHLSHFRNPEESGFLRNKRASTASTDTKDTRVTEQQKVDPEVEHLLDEVKPKYVESLKTRLNGNATRQDLMEWWIEAKLHRKSSFTVNNQVAKTDLLNMLQTALQCHVAFL